MEKSEKLIFTSPDGEKTFETQPDAESPEDLHEAEEKDWLIAKLLTEQPEIVPKVFAMSKDEFKEFKKIYLGKKEGKIVSFPTGSETTGKEKTERKTG